MENKSVGSTDCYCLKIHRTAGNVINFYNSALAASGITVRQHSLLREIVRQQPCTVAELAARAELDRSTLARSLKPLLAQGLILDLKKQGTRDSQLVLTEKGNAAFLHANALWKDAQKEFEKKLSAQQLKALADIMDTLQQL